jgi:phosphohistidine phosphatase
MRALQTWELAWEAMKELVPEPVVEIMPELYGADVIQLLATVHGASETDPKRLMLIGHNPGMHELSIALAGQGDAAGRGALADNLPTAGLAIFDFEIDNWTDVALRRGRLVQFISPKLIKQTSGD